jgi:hypothetical protein
MRLIEKYPLGTEVIVIKKPVNCGNCGKVCVGRLAIINNNYAESAVEWLHPIDFGRWCSAIRDEHIREIPGSKELI